MNKSTISEQLQHDYPDYTIYLDADNRMVVADDHKMSLLNSPAALQTMNIFSRSGRSFYQAITQLLCSNYNIIPKAGSYADTLIIRQEDLDKYKVQKLAKEWGIGFLETGIDVLAVEVEDGVERDLLLESNVPYVEPEDEELLSELEGLPDDEELNNWAKLEELDFDVEMAYLEKGIEFAAAMEEAEVERIENLKDLNNLEIIDDPNRLNKEKNKKVFFNTIRRILKSSKK